MSRRENVDLRCVRCRMHECLCVCSLIPRIETRTRLLLVIHRDEERKPTNSGQLAALCLPNSEVCVRGVVGQPAPRFTPDAATQPLLLFPHERAVPIATFAGSTRPVTIIVPDGTWRQAAKVRQRMPGLAEVPCVSLPPDAPTSYRLRAEFHDDRLATLEAIARALEILEGPAVRDALERLFRIMVERTLWLRGMLDAEHVTGAIPERA
ncbi:MAG TPA: tRNA-uridine aminocarboxypropyltransferase, partial [Polyangia bacterium]|nr:tRNA-uridine aminocarboxypropyltransferase [Polyangia bacterium]